MPKVSLVVIREVTKTLAGPDLLKLVLALKNKGLSSEFTLAEMFKEDINAIRSKLYRLQKLGLVSFKKQKDEERDWYVYFWQLNPKRFKFLYKRMLENEIGILEEQLKTIEEGEYYRCPKGCVTLESEDALTSDFICPICGGVLVRVDNSKTLAGLLKKKAQLISSIQRYS